MFFDPPPIPDRVTASKPRRKDLTPPAAPSPETPLVTRRPLPTLGERHLLRFMAQAFTIAESSYARDLKVGAVLAVPQPDGTLHGIAEGYNGTEPKTCNRCEDDEGNQLQGVIHAERNVLRKVMRGRDSSSGAWLFVTRSPCSDCAERILDADVAAVFYCEAHRDTSPLARLKQRGVHCERIDKAQVQAYFESISRRLRQPKFNETD